MYFVIVSEHFYEYYVYVVHAVFEENINQHSDVNQVRYAEANKIIRKIFKLICVQFLLLVSK